MTTENQYVKVIDKWFFPIITCLVNLPEFIAGIIILVQNGGAFTAAACSSRGLNIATWLLIKVIFIAISDIALGTYSYVKRWNKFDLRISCSKCCHYTVKRLFEMSWTIVGLILYADMENTACGVQYADIFTLVLIICVVDLILWFVLIIFPTFLVGALTLIMTHLKTVQEEDAAPIAAGPTIAIA